MKTFNTDIHQGDIVAGVTRK